MVNRDLPDQYVKTAKFAKYLEARIFGKPTHNWLDSFDIDVAGRLCENLGILINFGANVERKKLTTQDYHQAGELGFDICRQGEAALIQCLNDIKRNSPTVKGGFYTDFGFFARWLQRITDYNRYRALIDIVRNFVFDDYPIKQGEVVLGDPCPKQKNIHGTALPFRAA